MSHEHETPVDGSADSATASLPVTPDDDAMLTRAARILAGDTRPEDYLPVTPEVRAAADFELAYLRDRFRDLIKGDLLPEVVTTQLRQWLLSFHHGGQNIVYMENDKGVIVLAVGLSQMSDFVHQLPRELQDGVIFGCPDPFEAIGCLGSVSL